MANAQRKIQWQFSQKKDTMVVWGTANGEERREQQMGEESNVGLNWIRSAMVADRLISPRGIHSFSLTNRIM